MPVLVADDYPDSAESIALALELDGFHTVTASSGAEAIEAMEKYRPHAAVIDLKMPDIDGFTLARHFRESADPAVRSATLIAHSGALTLPNRLSAQEAGFDYFIFKPCAADHIAVCLRLADSATPVSFRIPNIDKEKMIALSERSQRAVERAKAVRSMYGHLFRLLND
jgi:CheY-like chemotaxis protein